MEIRQRKNIPHDSTTETSVSLETAKNDLHFMSSMGSQWILGDEGKANGLETLSGERGGKDTNRRSNIALGRIGINGGSQSEALGGGRDRTWNIGLTV
jgi:hypothetical protein